MNWLPAFVALCLLSTSGLAQSPQPRVSYCGAGFVGPFGQHRAPVNAVVGVTMADWHALASFDAVVSHLEIGYRAAVEYCRSRYPRNPIGGVTASIHTASRIIVSALQIVPSLPPDQRASALPALALAVPE